MIRTINKVRVVDKLSQRSLPCSGIRVRWVKRVTHVGDVEGGGSYTESLTAALPGVLPGDYQIIIRSDILNRIPETDEANNIGVALNSTTVDFEQISLGSSNLASIANGESVYYQVEVAEGETHPVGGDAEQGHGDDDGRVDPVVCLHVRVLVGVAE